MSRQFELAYREDLDSLSFTPAQKAAMAARALETAGKPVRRRKPLLRTALLAAAMAVVLVVGAGAAGILPAPGEVFAPLFGGSVAQTEIIDKIGRPIGASASDGGITITAESIMGDEHNAVIVYTISRDDGERFLPEGRTLENTMLHIGGFGGSSWAQGGSYGSAYFVDENPEDNAVQYVETATSDAPMTHGTATAEFEDLCCYYEEAEESVSLYPGHWKFRFQVDYEDCSLSLGQGETFQQDGLCFTVDGVSVSPIAVKVDYTVDSEAQWSGGPSGRQSPEDAQTFSRYLESVELLLTKTDGTVIDLSGAGGSIRPKGGRSLCTKGQVLEEIIPLEEMASLSVGGVVYPISAR